MKINKLDDSMLSNLGSGIFLKELTLKRFFFIGIKMPEVHLNWDDYSHCELSSCTSDINYTLHLLMKEVTFRYHLGC